MNKGLPPKKKAQTRWQQSWKARCNSEWHHCLHKIPHMLREATTEQVRGNLKPLSFCCFVQRLAEKLTQTSEGTRKALLYFPRMLRENTSIRYNTVHKEQRKAIYN